MPKASRALHRNFAFFKRSPKELQTSSLLEIIFGAQRPSLQSPSEPSEPESGSEALGQARSRCFGASSNKSKRRSQDLHILLNSRFESSSRSYWSMKPLSPLTHTSHTHHTRHDITRHSCLVPAFPAMQCPLHLQCSSVPVRCNNS